VYHSDANVALKKDYARWTKAYSGMSWKEYLNRVKTAEGTGQWIKEVIALEEGGSVN
jgi:hypothetical protein